MATNSVYADAYTIWAIRLEYILISKLKFETHFVLITPIVFGLN